MILDLNGRPFEIPRAGSRADTLSEHADRYREDRWQNNTTGIGTLRDKTTHGRFDPVFRMWDPEIVDLMNGSDIASNIVELPTFEMFRRGFDLTADGFETTAISDFREWATEEYDVENQLEEGHKWGRCFGGNLSILGLDDGRDPWEPLDESRVRGVRYINPVDRRYAYAQSTYSNMDAPKYGRPEIYLVSNGVATSAFGRKSTDALQKQGYAIGRIHESRCIRFDGVAADVTTRQLLAGWSWSVLQRPYEVLRQFDHAFDSAVYLLSDASQGVLKLQGLVKAMTQGKKAEIESRMELMELTRGVAHAIAIDAGDTNGKNAESFERQATPFAGIPEMLDRLMMRVAGASKMPIAKVFARGAGGLNAAGEAEAAIRSWYDQCESLQMRELAPKVKRTFRLLAMDKRSPLGKKGRTVRWNVKFHPLWSPTDDERAKTRYTEAQTAQIYIGEGVVTPEVVGAGLGDVYQHLDTKALEEHIEGAVRFDPYEGDAPEDEGGGPAANGGQMPTPAIPSPIVGSLTAGNGQKAPAKAAGAVQSVPQKPKTAATKAIPAAAATSTKPKKKPAAKPDETKEDARERAEKDRNGRWGEDGGTASQNAALATERAIDPVSHRAAGEAHREAALARRFAAARSAMAGQPGRAGEHSQAAIGHDMQSGRHEALAMGLEPSELGALAGHSAEAEHRDGSEDQPREPAGQPEGGEFASSTGAAASPAKSGKQKQMKDDPQKPLALNSIIEPHQPEDRAKVLALAKKYEDGDGSVPPVVVVKFGDANMAVNGSHRIAAMREAYERDADLDWEIHTVNASTLTKRGAGELVKQLRDGKVYDFDEFNEKLAPFLSGRAKASLIGK